MFKTGTMVAIAAIAMLTQTAPAFAKAEQVSRRVSYADLDLSTPAGQRSLHNRIAFAVRQICGDLSSVYSSYELSMLSKCNREAWSSSNKQVADAVSRATTGRAREEIASR